MDLRVECKGLCYAAVKHFRRVIHELCKQTGCLNPFLHYAPLATKCEKLSSHVGVTTGVFDPMVIFPLAFTAIEAMPWDPLTKVRDRVMFLMSTMHGLRSSSLAEYCPLVDDILIPPQSATHLWTADGLPTFFLIGYRRWKGRPENLSGDKDIAWLKVCRNFANSDACLVFWLLTWLGMANIRKGPIFPVIRNGEPLVATEQRRLYVGKKFSYVWYCEPEAEDLEGRGGCGEGVEGGDDEEEEDEEDEEELEGQLQGTGAGSGDVADVEQGASGSKRGDAPVESCASAPKRICRERDGMVNLKAGAVQRTYKKIFQAVGRPDLKSHSHRASHMRWAGKSGATTANVLQTTHHAVLAKSWLKYFGSGQDAYDELDEDGIQKLQAYFPYPNGGFRVDLPMEKRSEWISWGGLAGVPSV